MQSHRSAADSDIEIIDFYRPVGNEKNLFISNIFIHLEEEAAIHCIQEILYKTFLKYGPIYEVQVFPIPSSKISFKGDHKTSTENSSKAVNRTSVSNDGQTLSDGGDLTVTKMENSLPISRFYAFVKFYSAMCAKRAKSHLHLASIIGLKPVKITFASRKKIEKKEKLYLNSCYDLANFYLGFNGWTSNILVQKRDDRETSTQEGALLLEPDKSCRFLCIVELAIPGHGLVTQGVSTVEESWDSKDPASKSSALVRCRKRSYHYALENAFSKVLLVILGNGKVYAEIDTTQADPLHRLESLQDLHLVTVNELETEPLESSEEEDDNNNLQQNLPTADDTNVNILMELESGLCD